jgi:hypothetical protein
MMNTIFIAINVDTVVIGYAIKAATITKASLRMYFNG